MTQMSEQEIQKKVTLSVLLGIASVVFAWPYITSISVTSFFGLAAGVVAIIVSLQIRGAKGILQVAYIVGFVLGIFGALASGIVALVTIFN